MSIVLVHARANKPIELKSFVAAWRIWFRQFGPSELDWWMDPMPRLNTKDGLSVLLKKDHKFSLDCLCRMLASEAYTNMMHATHPFMVKNDKWIKESRAINPVTGNEVNGAKLRPDAVKEYAALPRAERARLQEAAAKLAAAIEGHR